MKKNHVKTNALRLLDKAGISYETREYEVDEDDLSGVTVAKKIGLPPEQVFKTLVVKGDKAGVFIASIPTNLELDLKKLAESSGNKKVDLVPLKDVQTLTGYIRGGVSPVGTKKQFTLFLDSKSEHFQFISLSAGVRGCQMLLNPKELSKILEVIIKDISK
jgi:Cys-tRNA(Pro)/Cys-tRNA(Cys) deacylase